MKKQTKKIALGLTCAMAVSMAAPAVQTAYAGSEAYKVTLGTPEERAIENVTLEIGESIDLNFYGVKDWNQNKANYKCSWSTSGDAVSVNNMGVVTAKKEGSAVVSLSIKDTKTGIYHDVVSTAVLVEAETPEVTETPEMVATPELRYALNEDGASYSVVGLDFYYGDTVIIGAEYEGLPVTAIGPSAFEEKRGLKTAVIAEGITTIGEYAFAFTKVETIQLPRTITTIAESALAYNDLATINYAGTMAEWNAVEKEEYWCNKEDGIEIICSDGIANEKVVLDSVVYKISGDSAGVYVVGLESGASLEAGKELTIAAEVKGFPVTEIASDAFEEEVDLEIVVIPEGVTTIRERAFWWSGLETIQLPSTITTIGYGAFMYSDLATVNYAGTMEEWKAVAKENCAGHIYEVICSDGTVTEKPELSYKLNEDGTSYFVDGIGSYGDNEIIIEAEYNGLPITAIDSYAFSEEYYLESVVISEGIITIGEYAFAWSDLETIALPSTVTAIERYALFASGLTTINYAGTMEEWEAIEKKDAWKLHTNTVTVTCTDGTITIEGEEY